MNEGYLFLFSKKPIETNQYVHSTISDILPATTTKPSPKPNEKVRLNNINYDEQIRAPRFNTFNLQTTDSQTEDHLNTATDVSTKTSTTTMDTVRTSATSTDDSPYIPAKFDLNNYTYSNSVVDDSNSTNSNLMDAINNLNENITSFERVSIKPIYDLKRPLSYPAVLRPLDTSNRSPTSISTAPGEMGLTTPTLGSTDDFFKEFQCLEPVHTHWKPNNYSTACMKCFKAFGNFFNLKKRHHCRFCGFLICSNCLYQSETSRNQLIFLDSNARFVVPIFKNLKTPLDTLGDYFKLCKICKNCGEIYSNILYNLNNNQSTELPFIIVENPYINKKFSRTRLDECRSSFGGTTDWNWSSF